MNAYINPTETQRRLDVFSQVKAASVLPAVDANLKESNEEEIKQNLTEVSILYY